VLDIELGAEAVEVMVSRGGTTAQAEEPVGEFLAVARRE
jgi:hypothetical protein